MFVCICHEVLLLVLPRCKTTAVCLPSLNRVGFLVGMLGCWSAVLVRGWRGQAVEQAAFLQHGGCCEVLGVKCWL